MLQKVMWLLREVKIGIIAIFAFVAGKLTRNPDQITLGWIIIEVALLAIIVYTYYYHYKHR